MAKMFEPGSREEARYEREYWKREARQGKFRRNEEIAAQHGVPPIFMDYLTGKGMTPEEARNFYNSLSVRPENAEPGEKTKGQILDDAVAYRVAKSEVAKAARRQELADEEAHKGELRRMTRGEGPPEDPNVTVERYRYMGKQLEAGKGGGPSSSGGGGKGKQEQAGAALPVSLSDLIAAEALGPKKPSGGYIESGGKKTYVPKHEEAKAGVRPKTAEKFEADKKRWQKMTQGTRVYSVGDKEHPREKDKPSALSQASAAQLARLAGDEDRPEWERRAAQLEMRARRSTEEYKATQKSSPSGQADQVYVAYKDEEKTIKDKIKAFTSPEAVDHYVKVKLKDLEEQATRNAAIAPYAELLTKRMDEWAKEKKKILAGTEEVKGVESQKKYAAWQLEQEKAKRKRFERSGYYK